MTLHILVLASEDEKADLCNWMAVHAGEDDWPSMTKDAEQWLGELKPGIHEVPIAYIFPLRYAIEDWEDVLASNHDEDNFITALVSEEAPA